MDRRDFIQTAALGGGVAATAGVAQAAPSPAPLASLPSNTVADPADLLFVSDPGERRGDMLYRGFGRSEARISAIGMGGFHLGKSVLTDDEAVRLIHEGGDRGITFMGDGWDYNEGRS